MPEELKNEYYIPSEDSFFFAKYIEKEKGYSALDIGTGSGILAEVLSKNFKLVVATDTNIFALKQAHKIIGNCICCNSADAFKTCFDLIVCNLPYLPSENLMDPAVDGMRNGVQIPSMILQSASRVVGNYGKILFLTSSLANYVELIGFCNSLGFKSSIVAKKRLFYEELILVECRKNLSS